MMTPAEIARRLDERFRLLTGGSRTAVERHQTLRAAVDWSYALLEPSEQEILDRLGVFAGGFTLEAAEAVAVDEASDVDVMELLGQLVDKSLVVAEEDADGGTRYRLLETIRQYALERLDARGEGDVVRRRHAECYVAFTERVQAAMPGPVDEQWVHAADREMANFARDSTGPPGLVTPMSRSAWQCRSGNSAPASQVHHRSMGRVCGRHAHRSRTSAASRCRGMVGPG